MSAAVQGVPRPAQPVLGGGRTAGLYPNMRPPHLKHTQSKTQLEEKAKTEKENSKKKLILRVPPVAFIRSIASLQPKKKNN
ncbi:UNVERIFIED_CONTAM: hypothetical protein NCL1_18535 [Trichonephila clavipes]